MRGIRGGGEKHGRGERELGHDAIDAFGWNHTLFPFLSSSCPLAVPLRYSIPSFSSNKLWQLFSVRNRFGTACYRSSRNGATVILHLLDPFAIYRYMHVYMYTYSSLARAYVCISGTEPRQCRRLFYLD